MAANTLATPVWVCKEVGRGFKNSVKFIANLNRTLSDEYMQSGARVGNTVKYRLPQRFAVTDGQALQEQSLFDSTVDVTLTNQKNVAFGWSSAQETTELDNVRDRYIMPAANALASAADVLAFQNTYRDIYQAVGTLGLTPSTTLTYLTAGVKLTDLGTPDDGRVAVLDPLAMATIANTSSSLFNPSGTISDNYRKGQFGANQLGIAEFYQDQNRPAHTSGTFTASTPLTNGAAQTGSSLITNGWASGASSLKRGDVFTIANVFSVNPLSYTSTGRPQQFVVTADISDTTGAMTIAISPPIIPSGQLQNVNTAPATSAAITVWSANPAGGTLATTVSPQSMVFHPDAFAFVSADLAKITAGATSTVVRSPQYGISIRMVEQYQIGNDQNPSRLDILIGAATLQARMACRVVG